MDSLILIAIPVVLFVVMFVVGFELTPADLRRVWTNPRFVVIATVGQFVLLPAIAVALVLLLKPDPRISAGMVLVASASSGAVSNAFTLLARANTAMSVTLTAVSSLASPVTMTLLAGLGFRFLLQNPSEIAAPLGPIFGQLVGLMVLPILLGFEIRRRMGGGIQESEAILQRIAGAGILGLIVLILLDQREMVVQVIGEVTAYAAVFTIAAMAGGYGLAALLGSPRADRYTLAFEFGSRNLAIIAIVAEQVFGGLDVLVFCVAFFLVQTPFALLIARIHRVGMPGEVSAVQ